MTSALQLLQKGYRVTVVAKEYASPVASGKRITSEIAGALWEWPPAVCGRHTDEKSLERSKVWCMDSYGKFMELAMNPKETGAYLRQSVFYFKEKVNVDLPRRILIWIGLHSIIGRQRYVPPAQTNDSNINHCFSLRSMIFPHSWKRWTNYVTCQDSAMTPNSLKKLVSLTTFVFIQKINF